MVQRVFLGWNQPFLHLAIDWLLARRDALPGMLLLVPTAQSSRSLRENLAETACALLTPRVSTPGSLLKTDSSEIASEWIEQLAWIETIEAIEDWSEYAVLFDEIPVDASEWAAGFAREIVRLRRSLQENGLLFSSVTQKLRTHLPESTEPDRWAALASLEEKAEKTLFRWGYTSRSQVLSRGISLPSGISHIVLAGVAELPPLVAAALEAAEISVTSLIAAPESEAELFTSLGLPKEGWTTRALPWPEVKILADPRQQAAEAISDLANAGISTESLAIAAADPEVGQELARTFTREGWIAFQPASQLPATALTRWFKIWNAWLSDPTFSVLQDLLSSPMTEALVSGRAKQSESLAKFRDRWMIQRLSDLSRHLESSEFRNDAERFYAREIHDTATHLERIRSRFLGKHFPEALAELLEKFEVSDATDFLKEWISQATPLIQQLRRPARFWLELMLSELPAPAPEAPAGRVLDVQGWLEIFHEPGEHLVLCGMNEGMVPARSSGEPWLNDTLRNILGLITDTSRAARDSFLYCAMVEARREHGSVRVYCGKNGAGGETLLPSRLLLAAEERDLPDRVKLLFKAVEPPEAGLRWHADWQWQPRTAEIPEKISVTSLADYLSCPFRYYLKHILRQQRPEPDRSEWNARDFGTITHEVLELWGGDEAARNFTEAEEIHSWLCERLNELAAKQFGPRLPLAIRIQVEALQQRLLWFSQIQAETKQQGWDIIEVERNVTLEISRSKVRAKIDRIDRHRETGEYRVIDYKTGKVKTVDQQHRKRITASTVLPAHLQPNSPAFYEAEEKGKSADFQWINLQLPVYVAAFAKEHDTIATPVYFTLGATASEVALHAWNQFSAIDLQAAEECTAWIVQQIEAGIFWPPADRVTYDDFQLLAAGREIQSLALPPQILDVAAQSS